MPSRQHFRVSAGEDRTLSLTARNGGAILDLTSYSIAWSLSTIKGGNPVVQKTGTTVSASAGTFTISLTDADTGLLKVGTYFHQALATSGGTTLNVCEGNIKIDAENTAVLQSSAGAVFNNNQFYGSRAEAALTKIGPSVQFVETFGYYTTGDGGGGQYKRTGAIPSHSGYFQSADGAIWELDTQAPINVLQFGAKSDGTNCATAFQGAINALPSGGAVGVPPLNFALGAALTANVGVLFKSDMRTDLSGNTNGSNSSGRARIVWTGATASFMYTLLPAVVGNVVWGGGSEGIEWNGADVAAGAVHFDNTKFALFDGKVRQVVTTGVKISSASGSVSNYSQQNFVRALEFVWGAAAASQGANGLTIVGNGSTVPTTQVIIDHMSGLVYNGSLLSIAECDNCQIDYCHGVVQSGGSGRAVDLLAGGAQGANNNVFFYCSGPVRQGPSLHGNTFLYYNTEQGGITQSSGSSQWGGVLVDYNTAEMFVPRQYALRDKLSVSEVRGGTSTTTGDFAAQWTGVVLADGVTRDCSACVPAPYRLNGGVIEGIEVLVGSNGTSAGNYRVRMRASTKTNATNLATPEKDDTQTVAAEAQYVATTITFTFSPELAFTKGDHLWLRFSRIGADAADTNTDDLYVMGFRALYRSSGPPTGTYTFTIPEYT